VQSNRIDLAPQVSAQSESELELVLVLVLVLAQQLAVASSSAQSFPETKSSTYTNRPKKKKKKLSSNAGMNKTKNMRNPFSFTLAMYLMSCGSTKTGTPVQKLEREKEAFFFLTPSAHFFQSGANVIHIRPRRVRTPRRQGRNNVKQHFLGVAKMKLVQLDELAQTLLNCMIQLWKIADAMRKTKGNELIFHRKVKKTTKTSTKTSHLADFKQMPKKQLDKSELFCLHLQRQFSSSPLQLGFGGQMCNHHLNVAIVFAHRRRRHGSGDFFSTANLGQIHQVLRAQQVAQITQITRLSVARKREIDPIQVTFAHHIL
jgi:hypothetical protein